jgi:hypothetical protein
MQFAYAADAAGKLFLQRSVALPSGPYKQEPRSGRGLGLGD